MGTYRYLDLQHHDPRLATNVAGKTGKADNRSLLLEAHRQQPAENTAFDVSVTLSQLPENPVLNSDSPRMLEIAGQSDISKWL
ncbi:MAG: hypothetical protein DRH04_11445 [Deltaproteobacteria bacterium]|nr:MAG: hypothetical protein DRH04_11445 [Deltaproteobacteria bacterium]